MESSKSNKVPDQDKIQAEMPELSPEPILFAIAALQTAIRRIDHILKPFHSRILVSKFKMATQQRLRTIAQLCSLFWYQNSEGW